MTAPHERNDIRESVTMREVAARAGVSVATVSRVLSKRGPASAETAHRVQRAVEQLKYHPSHAARSLKSSRSGTIGAVVYDLTTEPLVHMLRAADLRAAELGYTLVIGDAQASAVRQAAHLERFLEQRVEGLLIAGSLKVPTSAVTPFVDARIPVVPRFAIDRADSRDLRRGAERQGTADAVRHLATLGHRRLAYVVPEDAGAEVDVIFDVRREVLADLALEHDMELHDDAVVLGSTPMALGEQIGRAMRLPARPTALFVGSVAVLPAVLSVLAGLRVSVPDDLSVVCYGDSVWCNVVAPPISVLRRDTAAEGKRYIDSVIGQLGGGHSDDVDYLPSEFVARASTGPPPPIRRP